MGAAQQTPAVCHCVIRCDHFRAQPRLPLYLACVTVEAHMGMRTGTRMKRAPSLFRKQPQLDLCWGRCASSGTSARVPYGPSDFPPDPGSTAPQAGKGPEATCPGPLTPPRALCPHSPTLPGPDHLCTSAAPEQGQSPGSLLGPQQA